VAVQLPGRASRFAEPPLRRVDPIVNALAVVVEQQATWTGGRLALFGHSMGALIAYELARRWAGPGSRVEPGHLFVAGQPAPQLPRTRPPRHKLPHPAFVAALQTLGGTPPEVLDSPELLELVLPLLRADFEVCETYRYQPQPSSVLSCPITVFGAVDDDEAGPLSGLAAWGALTSNTTRLHSVGGGHFGFLASSRSHLVRILSEALLG
jgi:medium-chain acyl-[acyl-carrier-protein] hydrolase